MAENEGVLPRHHRKHKDMMTSSRCDVTEKSSRRSYPPDHWTQEADQAKQRRTLYVRDHNTQPPRDHQPACSSRDVTKRHHDYRQPGCGGDTAVAKATGLWAAGRSTNPVTLTYPQQSCSGGGVLGQASSSRKKTAKHHTDDYQLYMSTFPLPESPEAAYPATPTSPPRPPATPPVPDDVIDVDARRDDFGNYVYTQHIMQYLQYIETQAVLRQGFLENSPDVTPRMRGVLMDWILQVQNHEELRDDTMHLTVALIDQILSQLRVKMSKLQLVGITCLLIASKFNERFAPEISILCYLTENTFSPEEVIHYEVYLLAELDFRLSRPVVTSFLDRLLQVHEAAPVEIEHLSSYILDLSITTTSLAIVTPSIKAASALYLARWLLLDTPQCWDASLVHFSTYDVTDLQDTAKELAILLIKAPTHKLQGARTKYNAKDLSFISIHERVEPNFILARCFGRDSEPGSPAAAASVSGSPDLVEVEEVVEVEVEEGEEVEEGDEEEDSVVTECEADMSVQEISF